MKQSHLLWWRFLGSPVPFFFFFFFLIILLLKKSNCLFILAGLDFCCRTGCCPKVCGILVTQPGIKLTSTALEDRVLIHQGSPQPSVYCKGVYLGRDGGFGTEERALDPGKETRGQPPEAWEACLPSRW